MELLRIYKRRSAGNSNLLFRTGTKRRGIGEVVHREGYTFYREGLVKAPLH
jgi:hypothetical protein